MSRPSVYLAEQANVLLNSFKFFIAETGNQRSSADEKRLAFLAQIDFWEWQIDNLIYSFDTFAERSKVWDSNTSLTQAISRNGLCVRARFLGSVKWSRFYESYRYKRRDVTVSPVALLNEVVNQWNRLLDICEKTYCDPAAKNYQKLGAAILADLSKFRKVHFVEEIAEEQTV